MLALALEQPAKTWIPQPKRDIYLNSLRVAIAALELAARMGQREHEVMLALTDVKAILNNETNAA